MMSRLALPKFITRHVLFALIAGGAAGMGFILFLLEFDHFTSSYLVDQLGGQGFDRHAGRTESWWNNCPANQ